MLTAADFDLHTRLGIDVELLAELHVRRVDDREARTTLGVNSRPGRLDGVLYPYLMPGERHPVTHRLRRDHPELENGRTKNKYISGFGDRRHLFFATRDPTLLSETTVPVVPVEAEKGCLAVTCAARRLGRPVLAVGLGGCWGWRGRVGKTTDADGVTVDELGPLPDLDRILWTGRDVVLLFDANTASNAAVRAARRAFAVNLTDRGARVRIADLPAEPGVNGPDDYIGAHGDAALFALIDAARQTFPTFNQTDAGNAEFFAAHYGRDVRFDHRRERYLLWRQHRWQPDADAEVRRLAKLAMRQRFTDTLRMDNVDARSKAAKWAIASESRARLDALLYLAQAESPIADRGDGWDADSSLLGTPNGVVDLKTGTIRAARRDDRLTLSTSVAYDPDAHSDLWDHALQTILPDADVRDFFHVAVGYSATGDTRCDCWFLGNGSGRNGKGTLLQPIRHALGDFALELPGSIFDLRSERSPYELAALPGRRFVTSSESGDTLRLHHDRIKQLTGGDSMNAANKYEKAFEFDPVCKLWLSCNKKPRATDDTVAFWARVILFPFTQSFIGHEDRGLRPALVQHPAHQAAVLAWIVRGAVRYYADGLMDPPTIVTDAVAAYRHDSDPLALFLMDACELEPTAQVGAAELYEHYLRWADGQHYTPQDRLSATLFGRLMAEKFTRTHTRFGGVYTGLARMSL